VALGEMVLLDSSLHLVHFSIFLFFLISQNIISKSAFLNFGEQHSNRVI
jgi:hypothetical protein